MSARNKSGKHVQPVPILHSSPLQKLVSDVIACYKKSCAAPHSSPLQKLASRGALGCPLCTALIAATETGIKARALSGHT